MSQPIPNLQEAQRQAREFLDMKFSDFAGSNAEAIWEPLCSVRSIVKQRYQHIYVNDPDRFQKNILKRIVHKEFLTPRDEQLGDATVREVLSDMWCGEYSVYLDKLADIRALKTSEPEKFAKLPDESNRGRGTAKSLIDLLLALDDLAVHGTPIPPQVMREGIKILQAQFRGWSQGELRYGKRMATNESAAAEHYKDRAREIETSCLIGGTDSPRIPDFIPYDLRQRVTEVNRHDTTARDQVRGEIIELLQQHEPAQGFDLSVAASNAQEGAQLHQDQADFLQKYIGKLNEIAKTLAIPPDRPRGKADGG